MKGLLTLAAIGALVRGQPPGCYYSSSDTTNSDWTQLATCDDYTIPYFGGGTCDIPGGDSCFGAVGHGGLVLNTWNSDGTPGWSVHCFRRRLLLSHFLSFSSSGKRSVGI